MKIKLDRNEVLNLEYSLKKEYLLSNGMGSYASSTIIDCHTRKYHGLLVTPILQFGKMYNLLSKLETAVEIEGRDFRLNTNKHPGVFAPTGHQYIDSFELDSMPVTTYRIGDITISKTILMSQGRESVFVKYEVLSATVPLLFKVSPLLAYREIHALSAENMNIRPRAFSEKNGFKIDPYEGLPPLFVETSGKSTFFPSPVWWNSIEYLKERNRGYDYQEDLFCPGLFEIKAKKGDTIIIRATTHKTRETVAKEWTEAERAQALITKSFAKESEPIRTLKQSSKNYTIVYSKKKAVRAGYHWYRALGRDTLMSLPGLFNGRDDKETALDILTRYAKYERNGLLPDILDTLGENHVYNNADVSLLFILAVQRWSDIANDKKALDKNFSTLILKIISDILDGKAENIRVESNGIIYTGSPFTALTWMNGYSYGRPATPRNGAAVEINALWYNALRFALEAFQDKMEPAELDSIQNVADRLEKNFMGCFWSNYLNCLCDVVREDGTQDLSIRPNQLFAIALPYSPVPDSAITPIITVVRKHLVTPYGFRTLSPSDRDYKPIYAGGVDERDAAAHQGMVYPWFIGIYMDALLKVFPPSVVSKEIKETFSSLWDDHLSRYGLNQISEMFSPNPPYIAKGCMGHALNLAEITRVLETLQKS
ncbi:MAG: glycogen debranching enzyme N-terminal domain-containing protein [Fibrobacteres bacterium]|nr:glycogen debranching enzyme N-terminal domain-containing protein [Fibrobacterota bacterium]